LCDRIIGQIRNLLNTIANAIYPKAASIYKNSATMWGIYRRKTKLLLSAIFFVGAILIFSLANFIVYVLSKQHDVNAIMLLRTMAFVPVISAFNVFNMLDLLLKNNTVYIFRISTILVIVAVLVALTVADTGNHLLIGGFTFIIEISAWAMCEYVIKKPSIKNV
jgi:O-antigen/teichoic acid export membrane protein